MEIEKVKYATKMDHYNDTIDRCGEFFPGELYIRAVKTAAELGYGEEAQKIHDELTAMYRSAESRLCRMIMNPKEDPEEPDDLDGIKRLRPEGPRRLTACLPTDYRERFMGSFLGRGAGCTLGAALEFSTVEQMEQWAAYCGQEYPLKEYWKYIKWPYCGRYIVGTSNELTRDEMRFCPVDDDTGYSLLGLLTMEEYGPDFTHEDMAKVWDKMLTFYSEKNRSWGVYWGERIFLQNYRNGMPAAEAGIYQNPNVQSVAAWTRADSYGYVCPGWPERAAELAYRDASLNHRRNGVYASMFMAAAVSAGFAVNDPVKALEIALTEIPRNCMLAQAVRWAFEISPEIKNYRDAAKAVTERYSGMFEGHAINNLLFVVFGILIGGTDFTRVLGETVAMGFDNDCTGATAGSIVGASIGKAGVPEHWYKNFNGMLQNCFPALPEFVSIEEIERRYENLARQIFEG